MKIGPSIGIFLGSLISIATCAPNQKFGIDIPDIHSVQEAFKSFQNEPKPESVTELGESLMRTAAEHVGELKTISGKCVPDFSQLCPEGWESVGDTCKATSSYTGLCRRVVSFKSYTPEQKMNWSNSCQANWPCKKSSKTEECSDSERNYNQTCPLLFVKEKSKDSNNYVCVPDLSAYVGPCSSFVDFTDFSRESKRLWAESCGTQWPCMNNCSFVFDECPIDWSKDSDGSCLAPDSYKGSCDRKFQFTHYTQRMKLQYLKNCEIAFECSNECKKDYDKCPNGWRYSNNGTCTSPKYNEFCYNTYFQLIGDTSKSVSEVENESDKKLIINLNSLTYDNKVLFESKCSLVDFPCTEQDEYNWSKPCPKGWNLINDFCIPSLIDENDDCKSKKTFKDEEEKRKWSSFCQIPWPRYIEPENERVVNVEPRPRFILNGPVMNETGSVNVSRDFKDKAMEMLIDDRSDKVGKNVKRLKIQTAL